MKRVGLALLLWLGSGCALVGSDPTGSDPISVPDDTIAAFDGDQLPVEELAGDGRQQYLSDGFGLVEVALPPGEPLILHRMRLDGSGSFVAIDWDLGTGGSPPMECYPKDEYLRFLVESDATPSADSAEAALEFRDIQVFFDGEQLRPDIGYCFGPLPISNRDGESGRSVIAFVPEVREVVFVVDWRDSSSSIEYKLAVNELGFSCRDLPGWTVESAARADPALEDVRGIDLPPGLTPDAAVAGCSLAHPLFGG